MKIKIELIVETDYVFEKISQGDSRRPPKIVADEIETHLTFNVDGLTIIDIRAEEIK